MDADLNRLAAEAAVVDAEAAPADLPPAAPAADLPPPVDYLAEARALVSFIAAAAVAVFPALEPIYAEEKREQLARVTAPLMEQYGWDMGGLMGKYGNWINFAAVALPMGAQTYKAMQQIAAQQAAAKTGAALTQPQAEAAAAPVPMHQQTAANEQ